MVKLRLAEHGRGHDDAARAALRNAERRMEASSANESHQTARLPWDERLEIGLLHAELAELLKPSLR